MASVRLQDVHKRFGSNQDVISRVNLEIKTREFCVFVGPSGCGKSTLLRMVAGLEEVSSGQIFIDDKCVNEVAPAQRGAAMVFQSYALYPHMTVFENMAFGLRTLGGGKAEVEAAVREAARALNLEDYLNRLPKALSGGQRQRVAIGRAIVRRPKVFLFDEPLSNLDAALRVKTRLEIASLQKAHDASMIYVTHDQMEAMTLADNIVLLRSGKAVAEHGSVAQHGPPLMLYHRPCSMFVAGFIGSPKMNFLAVKWHGAESDKKTRVEVQDKVLSAEVVSGEGREGLTLGIRPEHIELAGDAAAANTIAARVRHIESLGEASYLYVELSGRELLTVRVEGYYSGAVGGVVSLYLPPHHIHLFNDRQQAWQRSASLPV